MSRRYIVYMAFVLIVGLTFEIGSLVSAFDAPQDPARLHRLSLADWSQFEEVSRGSQGQLSITFSTGERVRVEHWYPAYDELVQALRRQEAPDAILLVDDDGLVVGSEGESSFAVLTSRAATARKKDTLGTGLILLFASALAALWILRRARSEQSTGTS